MTTQEILTLMKEHFQEGGIRDDGGCCEWFATTDSIFRFAKAVYEEGYEDGKIENAEPCYLG
jgi:hypothetical protein